MHNVWELAGKCTSVSVRGTHAVSCIYLARAVEPPFEPCGKASGLQAGYAVIFLNRKHSIQPFTKGLPSGEILECLPAIDSRQGSSHDGSHIVQQAIARATEARRQGTLLRLSFETVFEYLSVRQDCCRSGSLQQL